jgi:glycosyltransferase involved in cell wall biosynthesis
MPIEQRVADRALRIGVDGRELVGRVTGVGRYIGEVLHAWIADPAFPHLLIVFVPADPPVALTARLGPRVTWVVTGGRGGTLWEQWHLSNAANTHALDVFFAGAYTAPLRLDCPFVLVIHDVSYFAHPEWFTAREGLRRRWLTRLSASRAHTILAVSAFSADEIVKYLGVPRAKVAVAHGGGPAAHAPVDRNRGTTVLFVGSLFNRRLIPELIAGFARALSEAPAARLVLVGDNRTHPHVDPRRVAAEAGVAHRVEWREYVTDTELDDLYASARVFAFLSTYEGFALTPLEAIARGVPPVLLDTRVAHEIYDGAAMFVTPDPQSIARALGTLLRDDQAHRALVGAGAGLLTRFTWSRTAATIRAALERAAGDAR